MTPLHAPAMVTALVGALLLAGPAASSGAAAAEPRPDAAMAALELAKYHYEKGEYHRAAKLFH
jgi:hypothetical protein